MKNPVKPKSTSETISSTSVPGARETASPNAKNQTDDGKPIYSGMTSEQARSDNNTKQKGGHAKK